MAGLWLPFPSLPRPTVFRRAPMRSPSSCASNFPACSGSPTAWNLRRTRVYRPASCCLPLVRTASAFQIVDFAAQWLACRCPLSTLRYIPRDMQRMTRGQDGSLLLSCIGLSPTITCQFVLAHSDPIFSTCQFVLAHSDPIYFVIPLIPVF